VSLIIGGLQKTTLADYPGKVVCTIFTVGCNFVCPFCHNKDLLSQKAFEKSDYQRVSEKEFFAFLDSRKKILDGVCITGGEPTLQKELVSFCQKIKNKKLLVKLDTNGSRPKVIADLITKNLVDFIAMDIKSDFSNYFETIGRQFPLEKIRETMILLVNWVKNNPEKKYEFRTTLVPTLHNEKIVVTMAQELKEFFEKEKVDVSRRAWILQHFRSQNCLNKKFNEIAPFSFKKEQRFLKIAQGIFPQTIWRGRD